MEIMAGWSNTQAKRIKLVSTDCVLKGDSFKV